MKFAVIGANGKAGSRIAAEATSRGHDVTAVTTIADALAGTDARLIVVGCAGSLFIDEAHSTMLAETPDFPEAFLPVARGQIRQLETLRGREDVRWTFISPAADFRADGERTGSYVQAGEEFTTDAEGVSAISYADYAVGLVDEAEAEGDAAHVNERITLVVQCAPSSCTRRGPACRTGPSRRSCSRRGRPPGAAARNRG
ncbi:hypothetical protein QP119_08775 [Corynebacterium frankenforstense]|uniref:NAD(P)-dependent oxidoreductase n=1 Tax=Corynebacterium frankenforstense TaxID=1230998 RepID=UPI00254DCC2A|nr:hypothetical protein [Corynebacterium frankenforstense]MDK6260503.1 hypothetical protein [Corynebacterium frankenforstense]